MLQVKFEDNLLILNIYFGPPEMAPVLRTMNILCVMSIGVYTSIFIEFTPPILKQVRYYLSDYSHTEGASLTLPILLGMFKSSIKLPIKVVSSVFFMD